MAVSPRMMLITYFGTLVYFDEKSGQLRHGPIGSSPQNVLVGTGGEHLEMQLPGNSLKNGPFAGINGPISVVRPVPSGNPHCFGLRSGGLFVCAEPDGAITVSRKRLRDFETFMAVTPDAVETLRSLLSSDWAHSEGSRPEILEAGRIKPLSGFGLQVGDETIKITPALDGVFPEYTAGRNGSRLLRRVHILAGRMKLVTLARYQPLIYWCAFGDQAIFDCLQLSHDSLREFGRYPGDVLIITDREDDAVRNRFPDHLQQRLRVVRVDASTKIQYTFARYRILDMDLEEFQPICYIDTDIIVDRDLTEFLATVALSSSFWIASELPRRSSWAGHDVHSAPDSAGEWFGRWLFEKHDNVVPRFAGFYNSGAFCFPDVESVGSIFKLMSAWADHYLSLGGHKIGEFYDQPFLNYALHRSRSITCRMMNDHLAFDGKKKKAWKAAGRRGFLHFQGIVGGAHLKLGPMQEYVDDLRRTAVPEPAKDAAAPVTSD